jgi:hypothetical protein
MKFLGNYRTWINPHWLTEVLNSRGDGRPAEGQISDTPEMEQEYQKARAAGYKDNEIYFWMFDKKNSAIDIPQPPFLEGKYHWWITKMLPGNFMPMHVDPHTLYQKNSNRFWMPLQDWQPGHIFMYEDQVITNYKAGDVWTYDNPAALHGAANIGYVPRIVLQISSYNQ